MSGMAGVITSEVNFPPVQTISDVYSSGTWSVITTLGGEGSPYPYPFFTNATPFTIMAYVTIYDQSEDSTGVSFINGTTWVGDLGSGPGIPHHDRAGGHPLVDGTKQRARQNTCRHVRHFSRYRVAKRS
jgi:hypothetical protein